MRTPTFRLPGLLLLIGLLGVIGGTIGWMVGFVTVTTGAGLGETLGAPIGYLLVGFAWWQWTPSVQAGGVAVPAFVRASRTLAVAAVATSITYLAHLYGNLRVLYSTPFNGNVDLPHFRLQLAGDAAIGASFLIAAVAFWIAARNVGRAGVVLAQPEVPSAPLVDA